MIWLVCLLLLATPAWAESPVKTSYEAILDAAKAGKIDAALQACRAVKPLLSHGIWDDRVRSACALLAMRKERNARLPDASTIQLRLARAWIQQHPPPDAPKAWPYALASAVVPGLGHWLLGRKRDALTAALLTWPMIALTLWAWRRRMGPVVVFFAAITLWLWSGVIFSATSLAHRGALEAYLAWWHALWQASGLPGLP